MTLWGEVTDVTGRKTTQTAASNANRVSRLRAYWTTELDDKLIHVRDVTQLRWPNVYAYFPEFAPGAVKRRYQLLRAVDKDAQMPCNPIWARENRPIVDNERCSTPARAVGERHSAQPVAISGTLSSSAHSRPCNAKRRRGISTPVSHREKRKTRALLNHVVASRSSRSRRLILHTFRHRPSEGYV